jgi:predicted aconitase with swiveling domain
MALVFKCRRIVGGSGFGLSLVTRQPINFLTMIDPETGVFHDVEHELHSRSLRSRVLVFPKAIGSSVGAYALYSLKTNGVAPAAIICTNTIDIITASACAISGIPAVDMKDQLFGLLSTLRQGTRVQVDADNCRIELIKKH